MKSEKHYRTTQDQIWSVRVGASQKTVLHCLNHFEHDEPAKLATIDQISQATRFDDRTVSRLLKSLIGLNLVALKEVSPEEARDICRSKTSQRLDGCSSACQWCLGSTVVLHNHHYPIPRARGGRQTVLICPNCHYEYHSLIRGLYLVNREALRRAS